MKRLKSIAYVHGPQIGLIGFALIGAIVEMACSVSLGAEHPIGILAYYAALFFAIAALCGIWSIVRFEQRYN